MMNQAIKRPQILAITFFTILIDMLGIGILIPVFPLLLNLFPSLTVISLSWLMASFSLMQFLFAPLLGQLADRFGRRKILALSILGTAFSYVLFAFSIISHNLPLMFIARFLDGATGGNISIAQTIIADVSPENDRAKNFGLVGVAIGVGFVLGPFLGGILSDKSLSSYFSAATPFYFAAIISFINYIWVILFVPETLLIAKSERIDITKPLTNLAKAFSKPFLARIMVTSFLFNSGFTFFTTFWGVMMVKLLHFTQRNVGNFYASLGIMIILAQGLVVRNLSGRAQDYKVLNYSLLITSLSICGYYLVPLMQGFTMFPYLLLPFLAAGVALTRAFSNALLMRLSQAKLRGEVMGISSSTMALAQSIPAILAGYIAFFHLSLPILIGSVVVASAFILFYMWNKYFLA